MRKLHRWLIGLGILGVFTLGIEYKINKMKPKPQFLSQEVSKQTLETSLDESFDVNSLNVVRYNSGEKPKFAVLTKWRGLEELGIRDIETDANSLPELLDRL